MKSKNLALIVLVIIMIIAFRLPGKALEAPLALESLLKDTGASVTQGEVQYLAQLENRFLTMAELEEKLLSVAEVLALEGGDTVRSEGATFRVLDVTGETVHGTQVHIVVQSNPGEKELGQAPQSYLLVVCRDSSPENIGTLASRLETVLQPLAPGGQASYYLTGELAGRYTQEEMSALAERALDSVRATIVEGMYEDNLISLTAYTPLIGRHLNSGDTRFNLNLAVRYDSHNDRTLLLAGFPLIHGSY